MKKLILAASFICLLGMFIFISGCKKDDICASCTESVSGTYLEDYYCGTPKQVDLFIKTLKDEGEQVGQHWSCTKH